MNNLKISSFFFISLCYYCLFYCTFDKKVNRTDPKGYYLTPRLECGHASTLYTPLRHTSATRPLKINGTSLSLRSVYTSPFRLSWHLLDYLLQQNTRSHVYTLRRPRHGRSEPLRATWNVVGAGETRYCWLCHIAFAATRQEWVCLTARRCDNVSHPSSPAAGFGTERRGGWRGG